MKLVPAKCPVCGGTLQVDPTKDAAICEFCKSPFIVEKAINNFQQNIRYQSVNNNGTINIENMNVGSFTDFDKLQELAKTYIKSQDYEKAESYVNRALELKPNDSYMLYLKARCLSFRQTDKIPPFSFLVLSIKNAQDTKTKEMRMETTRKYLIDNCSVLDEYLYEDFKNIAREAFELDNLYSKVSIHFLSPGSIVIDDDLQFSGDEGSDAKIFIISASNHYLTTNVSRTKLIDIPANFGNLNFVYQASMFGKKIKKV